MKPTTFQLPEETIKLLAKSAKKNKVAKQRIVNKALIKYLSDEK